MNITRSKGAGVKPQYNNTWVGSSMNIDGNLEVFPEPSILVSVLVFCDIKSSWGLTLDWAGTVLADSYVEYRTCLACGMDLIVKL